MGERSWIIARPTATAAELHAWEPPRPARIARWCQVSAPALVLGSAQDAASVDHAACAALGIEVVRRRSGGGAVLMMPGELAWLDVVVPADDTLWSNDVGRSMWWFGECWAEAMRSCGIAEVEVHRGPLVRTAWSSTVCFDGLGPGEVLVAGRKAVGISQRRTRHWARLQAAVHRRWRPELMAEVLAGGGLDPAELRAPWCLTDDLADAVTAAIDRCLLSV